MTANERRESKLNDLMVSVGAQIDREEKGFPEKEINKARKNLIKNVSGMYSAEEVNDYLQNERVTRAKAKKEQALNKNPLLEKRQIRAEGGDLDSQMDMLLASEKTHTMPDGTEMEGATHGEYEEQMEGLMDKETPMLPDEEMEEDYVDYVIDETLSNEDRNYLTSALEKDDRLSIIIDQIVESAHEFSGSGPIEGLGTDKSDSIPARLSDGEFVFTAKAVDEIGADVLQQQMEAAEAGADGRQGVAYGGVPDEDKKADIAVATQGSILAAGGVPPVVPIDPIREDQILSMQSSSPRRGYRTISG